MQDHPSRDLKVTSRGRSGLASGNKRCRAGPESKRCEWVSLLSQAHIQSRQNILVLCIPAHIWAATVDVDASGVIDVVQERLDNQLDLITLDPGAARSEACQVSNGSLLDDWWPIRLEPVEKVSAPKPLRSKHKFR